ncbi:uncharacterized protein LOC9317972 isoform X6 [Arabidopsis lyrata subsp. lyrata]|uniref:uncharacterized protein LOC9317972 isoform X6 n=1 Tax=Arabidopsis lyrata subsp. lyrata TaxID=81972 RepID=UPI000A29BBC4|nr:uncharacterized protein LOC9317972 isoform X6 [Arabidopsis lyrata subsp. lyrata]|eukprot:XP_020884213.1 uncharacterized protein LOC9317972 isoform X6 [Arabidopsis lyrata subsp. lyrata]
MDRLRDCLEEMVKFTLDCRVEFDLELTDDFCFGLLCGESILLDGERIESSSHALLHRFGGVPDYPLYKLLALGLLKSIDSGSVCGTFENISLGKEVIWLKEREDEWSKLINQKGSELVNALTDVACELHVQEPLSSLMKDGIKTVEARCFEAEYDRIRPRGSMVMINKCLMFEVMEVHQYPFFYELLKGESSEKVFPGTKTVEEGSCMIWIKRIPMVLWQSILVNQLSSLVLLWLTYCL